MSSIIHLLLTRAGHTSLFDTNSTEQANLAHAVIQQLCIDLIAPSLIAKELIHLIERASFGLGEEKQDVHRAQHTHNTEENVHPVWRGGDKTWCGHSDGEVVKPVGRRADRDALCAQAERKHLCDDDPCARAPREAKADGEEPDEDDGGPACGAVCGPVVLALCNDSRNNELTESHDDSANNECWFAAPLVDVEHGGDGREEHDNTNNTGS